MKNTIIIMSSLFMGFILLCAGFYLFMYFFMKPANPIMEYEFPNVTYVQLETKISNQNPIRLRDMIKLSEKKLHNSNAFDTRFVILGKDSLRFDFITNKDEGYKFKTKERHSKDDIPWIELLGIRYSIGKSTGINYKNKDEYPELIHVFEEEFIKKINNGEVDVIERGFWDWF